jgi:hypothetical protein
MLTNASDIRQTGCGAVMKKYLLVLTLALVSTNAFAQVNNATKLLVGDHWLQYARQWDKNFSAYWTSNGSWRAFGEMKAVFEFRRCMSKYGLD